MKRLDFTDPASLAALADMLTAAGVDGLEIITPDTQVQLLVSTAGKAATPAAEIAASPKDAAVRAVVKAPIAGHFHASHSTGADRFPCAVAADDVVGFVRIGPILVPVPAGRNGSLTAPLVEEDALVGFGDPLFEIELQS